MFWYIVICILMLYPFSIVRAGAISGKKTQAVALAAACFILWFFMAMRSTAVGVDTKYYTHIFTQFSRIPFGKVFTAETYATDSETWSLDFEYGYRLYNKLLSFLSDGPQMITICNSLLIIGLLYVLICKESKNYMLSIWLYLTLGIYQTEMNVARNAIAILIVYLAFRFLEQKRPVPYVLLCLLAASFHKAAYLFLPLYWLVHHISWKPNRIVGSILLAAVIGLGFPLVMPVLKAVLPAGLTRYFTSSHSKMESVIVGVFYLMLFLLVYILMNKRERRMMFERCHLGVTMFVLNLCCFALSFGIGYAARIAALFGPYIILFLPQMLDVMESRSKKKMIGLLLVLICGCQYILRLCVNNIGGTMPYTFFW